MNRLENITKPLMWIMALLLAALVAGCSGGSDPILGGSAVGTSAPTVSSTVPANAATGVQINRRITATFSEPTMNSATIVSPATSFKVTGPAPGIVPVPGTVTYSGSTAVFTPTSALAANSLYTATITTLVKNQAGIAMAANRVWSFTTGLTADTTAPKVISTLPADDPTGLINPALNADITATFSEPMLASTLASPATNFTICAAGTGASPGACVPPNITGAVSYLGNTATFNPNVNLSPGTWYTATVTTGAMDLTGVNALAPGLIPNPWSFKTAATPESTPPTVTLTNPVNLVAAAGLGTIPVTQTINATFSEAMSQATMVTANFTVHETAAPLNVVSGTVAYDAVNSIASFLPQLPLAPDTEYTVTVTNGAKDLAGNALVVPAVGGLPKPNPWVFRTAPASVPPVALAINLRGAASFGVASRAGLTSTGVTVVNGDVALYPLATCTDATGNAGASQTCLTKIYTSPTGMTVNGSIYFANDPFDNGGTANSVSNDLQIAWNEGLIKINTQGTVAADELGGKTFIPGVYTNANLGLATGLVATMDALGDANAIFIFQVGGVAPAGDLVAADNLGVPGEIRLANGAQAKNVWFVVGRDITIGINTIWKGNILAGRDATIKNDAAVEGRVLGGASGAGAIVLTGAASPSVTTITVPQ